MNLACADTQTDWCDVQEEPRVGREKLRKGMKYFISIYPDIRFMVEESSACVDSQKVIAHQVVSNLESKLIHDTLQCST